MYKKFKVKFKKRYEYQGRHFATSIGTLEGNILKITEETWKVIQNNPDSFLASMWRNLIRCVEEIEEINSEEKTNIKKEIIKSDFTTQYLSPTSAKEYVYNHRNVFSKYTRRYIINTQPSIIKEIDVSPDGTKKLYWYWVFLPNKVIIYQFERKPTPQQLKAMWNDIEKEKNK